ncbi:MAG: zinc-binding dehydrogenase [Aeromicrobium sp.]|uniref:zinc-binding dehydrogenase n=1 Tax=Aeromicrobium sp. TaxID=1871063 RepID=UPI0026092D71|nr:zinc-binding dehydrogenase [Aeromicrobium sp.]MDF1706156.1 zinc-binding dehydrogenase [Aeromicrobium sp.]
MWTYSFHGSRTVVRDETPAPVPDGLPDGTVLIRPLAGAICGSDMAFYRGRVSPFHDAERALAEDIPGFSLHEVVGEVVAAPGGEHAIGTRVVGWATGCDALAELVVTRASSVVPVTRDAPAVEVVSLQPLACVIDVVKRLPRIAGARVAVVGLGPIGLLFAHVLKDAGAAHVVGVDPVDRSAVAGRFGLDETVRTTAERWSRMLDDERPSVVVEAVGHQVGTLGECVRAVEPGGTVFYFGVPDDMVYPVALDHMFRNSVTLMAGNVRDHAAALRAAISYRERHPRVLTDLVSHTFDVHDASAAYRLADTTSPERLKVVLDFTV